ncbi:cupin domain-containing protein [Candidatus Litorirhabdus singularis]|uniref:cupin domain-containing protein n=1 Tax=Candidatus Litorirhabdus singularis TaxID=2518993 RepID=UPI00242DD909|nr:cupin domain-containing protein [Candidatus Litorirhabdus singularis]
MNKQQWIDQLGLQAHIEGGYFKRSFASQQFSADPAGDEERLSLTCIYYMLSDDSPLGYWHRNRSDIVHFFHQGAALDYYLLQPDGVLSRHVLGSDAAAGEVLQLAVPGGTWKCTHLSVGEYGLISEAVVPGFEYADMELGSVSQLSAQFPQHTALFERYCKPAG